MFLWDFFFLSVGRMMGEDRRGVPAAMRATWVAALTLCVVMTSVCAVEGRCEEGTSSSVRMMRGEGLE